MANQYVLSNIRAFLTEGFTAEELRRFCYDEPDFRPVYDHLAVNSSKAEIVDQLLEHAERKRLIDKLLIWAKENNSAAYEEYQPYRDIPPLGPPSNPFFFGGPVLPENFVGHRQAVEFCHDKFTARQPANIAVSGERRIGKTSLLHYLHKFGPQEAWGQHLCLFLDCGVFGGSLTPSTFWREMLHLLRHSLDPTSSILHQVIDLAAQPNLSGQDFRRLLNNYYRLYPQQFVVLLLDEFELIFQNYNSDVETLLNDLRTIDVEPGNKFILVTATRESLSQVCQPFNQKMGLEFHSRFVACPLKPFDEQETRYVVQTLLRGTNIEFAEQEFNYIWQLSQSLAGGAHPIFVQMAGSLIFAYKRNNQNLIDYFPLEAEFKKQTEKYRAELPEPPPPAIIDYELALNTLEQSLPIDNSDLTLEFYKWAKLFRRIHEAEPSQDPSPPSPNDREVIVNELTRLALKITGLSLEQLASGQKP